MTIDRNHCTVLLIDDELAGLRLRKRVLERAGFRALSTSSDLEGMSLFRLNDVDVVVTDHLLGRSTAAGMVAAMKRLKPHIPIISLSGTTNVEEALTYADDFVAKAEGPEKLLETLDRVLGSTKGKISLLTKETPPGGIPLPSKALLAAIVEDSSDAILSKTLDGTITTWNHAAELMYGYSSAEIVGKSVAVLLPPDRPDEVTHILNRLRRGERIYHFETVRVARGGRRIDVALTISPIRDLDGKLLGASTISRDISEQRSAQEALRKAETLALAGRMAATVAHEINNPLEAIGNILYLLRNSVNLPDEAREYVDAADQELKRVAEITKLALGMHRASSGMREPVEIKKLLENVLALYERKTKTLRIKIEREYLDETVIVGLAGELRQVFSNLIVNAMDALAISGTRLVVRVHNSLSWSKGVEGVRVSILDDGTGISADHLKHIFQAFYTTKGDQGTGIGLWISKSIVEKHGGTLQVRSSVEPGRSGTCFSVFLPLRSIAESNAMAESGGPHSSQRMA